MNGLPHKQWWDEALEHVEANGGDTEALRAGRQQWKTWGNTDVSLRLIYGGDQMGYLQRATKQYYDLREHLENIIAPHGLRLRYLDIHGG